MSEILEKQGYKYTEEFGYIPDDWEYKTFGDISTVNQGLQIAISNRYLSPAPNRYVYITIQYLNSLENPEYIENPQKSVICNKDDLLMTRTGNTGVLVTNVEGVFHNNFFKINYDRAILNKKFLTHYLSTNKLRSMILLKAGLTTIPDLSHGSFFSLPIIIPPLKEQEKIAEVLGDVDSLIDKTQQLINKKKDLKIATMQKLLTPKEDWMTKTLGELGEISGAGVDKKVNDDEIPIRLVNFLDVYHKDFINSKMLNHWVTAKQEKISQCQVKKGDIFFTPSSEMRYDIGMSAVATEDINDAVYSYHVVRLRLKNTFDIRFSSYIFNTKFFLSQAETICEGSGKRYVITLPKFREMKIFYPEDIEIQNKIGSILYDMDLEIEALEKELNKYKDLKTGMMQQLLTGKVRLI